jgi:hypothetical protein
MSFGSVPMPWLPWTSESNDQTNEPAGLGPVLLCLPDGRGS